MRATLPVPVKRDAVEVKVSRQKAEMYVIMRQDSTLTNNDTSADVEAYR